MLFAVQTVRLSLVHIALVLSVVIYLAVGAFVFYRLEGDVEKESIVDRRIRRDQSVGTLRNLTQEFLRYASTYATHNERVQFNEKFTQLLLKMFDKVKSDDVSVHEIMSSQPGEMLDESGLHDFENLELNWNYASSLFFAFTAITTIGYGNIAPKTIGGQVFCMIYALFGIPLTMLVIADLGKFFLDGISSAVTRLKKFLKQFPKSTAASAANKSDVKDDEDDSGDFGGLLLLVVFLIYIMVGAALCPLWEKWNFFDGIYFCFVTLTTIGFGDIYPKNLDFVFPTIFYITVGLALTTMTIDVAGTLFKKLHYLGAKLKNVKKSVIWFGGKNLTVMELVEAVGKNYGIPPEELANLNLDTVVEAAIMEKEEGKKPETPKEAVVVDEEFAEPRETSPLVLSSISEIMEFEEEEMNVTTDDVFDNVAVAADSVSIVLAEEVQEFANLGSEESKNESVNVGMVLYHETPANQYSLTTVIADKVVVDDAKLDVQEPKIEFESSVGSPAPSEPDDTHPKKRSLGRSIHDHYRRSLSASLGLKLPTAEELEDLRIPKPTRVAAYHNDLSFHLVKTSHLRAAKLPNSDRCKHCLVAFPHPSVKTQQKERGPRNMALVHWEKHFEDSEELRATVIHPWYQCLLDRYSYFSLDLMVVEKGFKGGMDSKHLKLLKEQLGIENTNELKEENSDWRLNPHNANVLK